MKNISKKILQVMDGIGAIAKDKKNSFHNYKYVSDEAIVTKIRELLIKAGLIVIPNQTSYSRQGDITTICVNYTMIDSESGDTIQASVYGEGQDKGDKGSYKAATGAEKYFLLKTFLIPTSDDPEAENGRGEVKEQVKKHFPEADVKPNGKHTATTFLAEVKELVSKKGTKFAKAIDSQTTPYLIFDKNLIDLCKQSIENSQSVVLSFETTKYGNEVKEVEIVG